MYVCLCLGVGDKKVREAVEAGARNVSALGRETGAGTDCGQCRPILERMIDQHTTGGPDEGERSDR